MDRADLEQLDRDRLIEHAESLHVPRARVLTRPELIDEILLARARVEENPALYIARGFFGRARDLVARVVERGLHLPDAAERIRSTELPVSPRSPLPGAPVPTVTLAEMYAAQGHLPRAVDTLREVLRAEPDHQVARQLLDDYEAALETRRPPPPTPEMVAEAEARIAARAAGSFERKPADFGTDGAREGGAREGGAEAYGAGEHVFEVRSDGVGAVGGREPAAAADARRGGVGPEPEVDACVAVPIEAGGLYVLWQLTARARAHGAKAFPGAPLTIRLLVLEPTWHGPRRSHRDVVAGSAAGEVVVRGLPKGAVVRVALGWAQGEQLHVMAHSPALELPAQATWPLPVTALLRRTPTGTRNVSEGDGDAPVLSRALERAAAKVE